MSIRGNTIGEALLFNLAFAKCSGAIIEDNLFLGKDLQRFLSIKAIHLQCRLSGLKIQWGVTPVRVRVPPRLLENKGFFNFSPSSDCPIFAPCYLKCHLWRFLSPPRAYRRWHLRYFDIEHHRGFNRFVPHQLFQFGRDQQPRPIKTERSPEVVGTRVR